MLSVIAVLCLSVQHTAQANGHTGEEGETVDSLEVRMPQIEKTKTEMLAMGDSCSFVFTGDTELEEYDPHAYWLMNRMMQMMRTIQTAEDSWAWMLAMRESIEEYNSRLGRKHGSAEAAMMAIDELISVYGAGNQPEMNTLTYVNMITAHYRTIHEYSLLIEFIKDYNDENDDDIQNQPYILIRRRKPVLSVIELALSEGIGKDKLELIIGDNDTFEESGEAAKEEIDNKVTVVYKFYKQNGTVHYSIATKWLEIANDIDLGITLYPIAHMTWENKEGSARGEGEVRHLIPNQIEVNRTEVRRVLTVKHTAFQQKVVDVSKIANPGALDTVGATIRTNGAPVEDVHKIVGYIPPAQMSRDVVELQEGLITLSRELAGAGDTATGQVNPEAASGRAILAVQQASQAPMTEQKEKTKSIIEDIAKIDIEYIVTYSEDGISVEETVKDERTGEEVTQLIKVPQSVLENLKTFVKIDVTPKGVYDKYAREMSLENFLTNGLFNVQRLPELKAYVKALPNDSVVPKDALLKVIEEMEAEQRKIALIQAEAEALQERAQQFLWEDPDGQAEQIADAQRDIEAEMAAGEAELDEETAEAEEEIEE